jgi:LysM repeat protein
LRINILSVFITVFSFCYLPCTAQKASDDHARIVDIAFIVRNGDHLKNIAAKTKVPIHEIVKANNLRSKSYYAYPGSTLILPVRVQPKVWDPTAEDMSAKTPSRQDRGDPEDYVVAIDSANFSLVDDFINLKEAQNDSVEYENIEFHIHRIDSRLKKLNIQLDSIKQEEFSFGDDQDANSILNKLRLARDKYYAQSPTARQIDSLNAQKQWLGQRRILLRNHITEYEYLLDNAGYEAHKDKRKEKKERGRKSTDWGTHLSDQVDDIGEQPGKPDTATPKDTLHTAPVSVQDSLKTIAVTPADTMTRADSLLTHDTQDNQIDSEGETAPVHYMSDFALVPKQKYSGDIIPSPPDTRRLEMLDDDQASKK